MPKTLIIKGKDDDAYLCIMGKYRVRLVLNEVSKGLPLNAVVTAKVTKDETAKRFTLIPTQIISVRDGAELYRLAVAKRKAEYWMVLAENDANKGLDHTKAIINALQLSLSVPKLAERRSQLEKWVQNNKDKSLDRRLKAKQAKIEQRISKSNTQISD